MSTLRGSGLALMVAALLAGAHSADRASAEPLPSAERLRGPESILQELTEMLVERGDTGAPEPLARLDSMLARLGEPNEMRGFVQFVRAVHLDRRGRVVEARAAVEESVRLLPGYSGPLLLASRIEVYADRPEPAADYLIRASEIDPEIVRRLPPYELDNLRGRLDARQDLRRSGRLTERLLAIGWEGDDVHLRSLLALDAIRSRIDAGEGRGARELVPRLVAPGHLRALLIEERFRSLWPDVLAWGGERQERQWPIYLRELRARYEASGDPVAARRYGEALRAAEHHRTIASELLPLFLRPLDRARDYDLLWVATTVADSLARLGRWRDIETMFSLAAPTWPLGLDANALNIAANRARFLLYAGKPADALAAIDRALAEATRHPGEVSEMALSAMHLARACALNELGRGHQAFDSAARVLASGRPMLAADLHLCFERHEAARAALVGALAQDATRGDVLAFLQPSESPPMQSDYGRRSAARRQALREDRILIERAARYGRVLPHSASAGVPPESEGR